MGGGGVIGHMVTSIKNNSRRKTRVQFDRRSMQEKVVYKKGTIDKKATPHQLREIRERLQRENKRQQKIKIVFGIACAFIAAILFIIFNFVTF